MDQATVRVDGGSLKPEESGAGSCFLDSERKTAEQSQAAYGLVCQGCTHTMPTVWPTGHSPGGRCMNPETTGALV